MARSDLLVSLVKAGAAGDKRVFQKVVEALIAEERAKQHRVLADQLEKACVQTNGNGQQALMPATDFAYRARDFVSEVVPRRRLEELILPKAARTDVNELIEEQHRASVLRAHGVEPRNRILLVGPPGTGKTTLAEAIAGAVAISLFVVRYEAIIGSYLGETASRLKRVFEYARTTPCVLFFDEFDAIGKERGDIHETGEIKRVVTSLLMQIDELPTYTIVVAATNHPELLDRASWRRFQVRINLPLPTQRELGAYIEALTAPFGESLGTSAPAIAKSLAGISYAEAEQFCLALRRRQLLAMGTKCLRTIVGEQLEIWTSDVRAKQPPEEDAGDARASAASTSRS
jgi:SpoVK/Ycf46/Vps4 family AAA+-type ATPase